MPQFTHAELMVLLDATAQYAENEDPTGDVPQPEAAETAREKLELYAASLAS